MRSALALGLLITLCYSADAATVHHLRTHRHHYVTSGFANSFAYEPVDRRSTIMYRKRDPLRPRMVALPCCLTLTTRTVGTLALRIGIQGRKMRHKCSRVLPCGKASEVHAGPPPYQEKSGAP